MSERETSGNGRAVEEDPRITAYALGELPEGERAAFERELALDPALWREVEELRATGRALEVALSEEPRLELGAARRAALADRLRRRPRPARRPLLLRPGVYALAGAAALVACAALYWLRDEAPESAPFLYDLGGGGAAALPPTSQSPAIARELEGIGYAEANGVVVGLGYASGPTGGSAKGNELVGWHTWAGRKSSSPSGPAGPPRREVNGISVIDLNGFGGAGPGYQPDEGPSTEAYAHRRENDFLTVAQSPLSTFSIDVDTASYSNVRRFLDEGRMPPPAAVRIEELVNYFRYDYPQPSGSDPFSISVDAAAAPWRPEHRLVRVGLLGRAIDFRERVPANLVFLLDVSGSMSAPDKLPLVKQGMRLLVDQLDGRDSVAIAVYAGAAGLVLPPTPCAERGAILGALDRLSAGGSTNGGQGIRLAYQAARAAFREGGINRVILCTDGDFNVGTTSEGELVGLIEQEAKSGVFLSVLGFGRGNLKDSTMEQLADRGNGNYAYIDSLREARRVLVEQVGGTLVTIAKDVKIQVEFNPAHVAAYRLIGYENRVLAAEDFNDDRVDAGEIGAGHTVTALYEVVPVGADTALRGVDPLRYQRPAETSGAASPELLTVKLRYKEPEGATSRLLEQPLVDAGAAFGQAPESLRFAAAVAGFGMLLSGSEHAGGTSLEDVHRWAREAMSFDPNGYRMELLELVSKASRLSARDGE